MSTYIYCSVLHTIRVGPIYSFLQRKNELDPNLPPSICTFIPKPLHAIAKMRNVDTITVTKIPFCVDLNKFN